MTRIVLLNREPHIREVEYLFYFSPRSKKIKKEVPFTTDKNNYKLCINTEGVVTRFTDREFLGVSYIKLTLQANVISHIVSLRTSLPFEEVDEIVKKLEYILYDELEKTIPEEEERVYF